MNAQRPDIALLLPSFEGGGVQRALVTLALGLQQHNLRVDLVVGLDRGPFREWIPDGLRVIELGKNSMLANLPALAHYLRTERPAVLFSAQYHVNLVAILARALSGRRVPLVVSERNDIHAVYHSAVTPKARLVPLLVPLLYPFADRIVAVSRSTAERLAGWARLPLCRVETIYSPIDFDGIQQQASLPLEHPWFGVGQLPVILAVGRLEPQKDYPTLLRAFALLRQKIGTRLVILGEGRLRPELEKQVCHLGIDADVLMPGYEPNPYAYMARSAVFVLSSAWEGSPRVLVEALACGCPSVATDCPGGSAEILEGGLMGRLVAVGDAPALADAIFASLHNHPTPDQLRQSAQRHSTETVLQAYLDLFAGLSQP